MPVKTFQNHYLITQELANGVYGRVYLVEDLNYQNRPQFIVQQIQPNYASCRSPLEREFLWQEAKKSFDYHAAVLQKISQRSCCIPPVEEYFAENHQLFLVQDQIKGKPLSQQLRRGMRWSQQETILLLMEILEALNFCHQEGMIHRDLHPDHIWRGQNGKLFIINFGALQEIQQLTVVHGRAVSQSPIGTEGYMPIEQLSGLPVLASDIHAVGVIGIQALTGLHPLDIAFDYDQGIPAWQKTPDCYVTDAFAQIINCMLADLPNERYPNAGAALAALQSLLCPVSSLAPSLPPLNSSFTPQEFIFESTRLYYRRETPSGSLSGRLVEEVSGWLGIEDKTDRQANSWQVKTSSGTGQCFVEDLGNGISLEMVYIPGDDFIMGAPEHEVDSSEHERPQHMVTIPAFYMGRYPVTQEQYVAIMGINPASRQGSKLPIENVSWHDARQFCQKLSERTGRQYRLPSEAIWEYACRAGTSTPFHYGETITTEVANFNGNYPYGNTPKGQFRQQTTVVDRFTANNFGLSDMHGNVWEWCEDHWYSDYSEVPIDGTAAIKLSAEVNSPRVLRGGSWFRNSLACRSAARQRYNADFQFNDIGFRVVYLLA